MKKKTEIESFEGGIKYWSASTANFSLKKCKKKPYE